MENNHSSPMTLMSGLLHQNKVRSLIVFLVTQTFVLSSYAQASGTITVYGDFNKFYPVTWYDANWGTGPTEVSITRPDVHENSTWRGALTSNFTFHLTNWGHGAAFVQPFITSNVVNFIAGYRDATPSNSTLRLIIWMRGGGTTYHYSSAFNVAPIVYDGQQNVLPYSEINGPSHSYKVDLDPGMNPYGSTQVGDNVISGQSFLAGKVGIGTRTLEEALNVNGKIKVEEVKVVVDVPADYVFDESYDMMPLEEVEKYVTENKHLPNIPSEKELKASGWEVGAMSNKMLEKIEELTLYLIEQNKKIEKMQGEIRQLRKAEQ